MSVLARIPVLGLLAAHPGSRADPDRKLRARPAADDARTDGPPPDPATGAARYPPGGVLLGGQPRRPGSAGLPARDPDVLARMHRRLGLPRETETEAAS
jgi:hypothetical protein